MFEHRLGLALGMSIGQLRSDMSESEFRSWKTYYKLEPWGFPDREYRTAAIMMMLNNTNITKRKDAKRISDFIRDPVKAVNEQIDMADKRQKLLNATKEERADMIAKSFGSSIGIGAKVK